MSASPFEFLQTVWGTLSKEFAVIQHTGQPHATYRIWGMPTTCNPHACTVYILRAEFPMLHAGI